MEIIKRKATYVEVPIEMKYVDFSRRFHDGLNEARERLLHYMEVIERKRREWKYEKEKVSVCKSSSG